MAIKDYKTSSSNIILFIRGWKDKDRELIEKMMKAAEVNGWEIKDINTHEPSTFPPCKISIAFGPACGRIVRQSIQADHYFILPPLKQLYPIEQNVSYRKKAWKSLKEVRDLLQGKIDIVKDDWGYAILRVKDKRLCIYGKNKPVDKGNDIDVYLNEGDCKLLLDIYKAFKANSIAFGSSEDDNENNSSS